MAPYLLNPGGVGIMSENSAMVLKSSKKRSGDIWSSGCGGFETATRPKKKAELGIRTVESWQSALADQVKLRAGGRTAAEGPVGRQEISDSMIITHQHESSVPLLVGLGWWWRLVVFIVEKSNSNNTACGPHLTFN